MHVNFIPLAIMLSSKYEYNRLISSISVSYLGLVSIGQNTLCANAVTGSGNSKLAGGCVDDFDYKKNHLNIKVILDNIVSIFQTRHLQTRLSSVNYDSIITINHLLSKVYMRRLFH